VWALRKEYPRLMSGKEQRYDRCFQNQILARRQHGDAAGLAQEGNAFYAQKPELGRGQRLSSSK
jgi:hypothetical protein